MEQRLNIESDEAVELASALTALTGETVADAVIRALRDRLEREQASSPADTTPRTEDQKREMIRKARAITADMRSHLNGPISSDHGWLYGEDGLPQ